MALTLPEGMNEHYGRSVDKMPEILEVGQVPASVARFMQARIKSGERFPDLWNTYVNTSDLSVNPKGKGEKVYVLLTVNNKGETTSNGRKALELIRQENLASNHGVVVERLRDLGRRGLIKIPRREITTERYFTKDQALNEKIWRILARHPDEVPAEFAEDKDLLGNYFDAVKSRTGYKKNMALYVGNPLKDKTTLKTWCVGGLECGSVAFGWLYLDDGNGRFVSLAPEAPVESRGGVGVYTVADLERVNRDLRGLEAVVGPEMLEG